MKNYPWNTLHKIGFRFSFIYILSIIVMMNNGALPMLHVLTSFLGSFMKQFAHWFAKNILHYNYDIKIFNNGSGDTSYNWMTLLILFFIAIIGTVIWTLVDKKKKNYQIIYYWLTVIIRYYIAFMLINYGIIKLIHAQMPPLGLDRLMQPIGEVSPMGLAWTYFGYSKGFNIFVGMMEILSGLLLFRRTVVLGALITMAVSVNIMSVNYFFDVPVKIVSTILFIFSIYLLLPYVKPLYNFLIRGKSEQIERINRPKFNKAWKNYFITGLKITLICIFVLQQSFGLISRQRQINQYFKKSPLYGIYKIDKNSDLGTLIPKDWSYIIFNYDGHGSARDRYYKEINLKPIIDTSKYSISLNNYTFNYSILENGDIHLSKEFEDNRQEIKLVKQKPEEFELMKRKFNLIQEYPHNR